MYVKLVLKTCKRSIIICQNQHVYSNIIRKKPYHTSSSTSSICSNKNSTISAFWLNTAWTRSDYRERDGSVKFAEEIIYEHRVCEKCPHYHIQSQVYCHLWSHHEIDYSYHILEYLYKLFKCTTSLGWIFKKNRRKKLNILPTATKKIEIILLLTSCGFLLDSVKRPRTDWYN